MYWSSFWKTRKRLSITLFLVILMIAGYARYFTSGLQDVTWETQLAWLPMFILTYVAMNWVKQDRAEKERGS